MTSHRTKEEQLRLYEWIEGEVSNGKKSVYAACKDADLNPSSFYLWRNKKNGVPPKPKKKPEAAIHEVISVPEARPSQQISITGNPDDLARFFSRVGRGANG